MQGLQLITQSVPLPVDSLYTIITRILPHMHGLDCIITHLLFFVNGLHPLSTSTYRLMHKNFVNMCYHIFCRTLHIYQNTGSTN